MLGRHRCLLREVKLSRSMLHSSDCGPFKNILIRFSTYNIKNISNLECHLLVEFRLKAFINQYLILILVYNCIFLRIFQWQKIIKFSWLKKKKIESIFVLIEHTHTYIRKIKKPCNYYLVRGKNYQ